MSENSVYIVATARTPIGSFQGALSSLNYVDLGAHAVTAALSKVPEIKPEQVEEIVFGNVVQANVGQNPARQVALKSKLGVDTVATTVNKVCASGMRSVALADLLIRAGEKETIVAGGMESMSNAPYILPKARTGYRMGHGQLIDLMIYDGLTCSFTGVHMGTYGNSTAEELGLTREAQDQWALRSHERACAAIESGTLQEEIVPVEIVQRKGQPIVVSTDEAPRKDTSLEKLANLKPAFDKNGTITAGNAPGVNDGACALVLMSEEKAEKQGKKPLAKILANATVAVEAKDFPKTPGLVINLLLEKVGKTAKDIDLFEINEAFSAVTLASAQIAGLDLEKVNVNGGAVALGHPIGASGARIILTLAYELRRRGGGLGIAAICSGGGQGDAILIEVPKQ
ncbi:MAG: acetyl-CoA C-acetyltransferase [Bacillus sp. (in: Bacteria)]|nr:acetyl-CoA C-acetyltransferase [Bacillus sp. (in: firmicutes)]